MGALARSRRWLPWRRLKRARAARGAEERAGLRSRVARHVVLHADLPGRVVARHVAHLPEDLPLRTPGPVVAAQDPHDPAPGVRVAPVQAVLVVELHHDPVGLLGALGPVEDLLAPEHPQVVVDDALAAELVLGGVPERVVGLRALELLEGVDAGAGIVRVLGQGREGEARQAVEASVVRRALLAGVQADLAPGDELVHEAFGGRTCPTTPACPSPSRPRW